MMNNYTFPDFSPHYCGKCGAFHQGTLCLHERQPQGGQTVVYNVEAPPTLREEDIRRIIREELDEYFKDKK